MFRSGAATIGKPRGISVRVESQYGLGADAVGSGGGMMPGASSRRAEFLAGARMLGRGFSAWRTHPRIMLVGAIPVLIVAVCYTVLLIWWISNIGGTVRTLLPFLADLGSPWNTILTVLATIALIGIGAIAVMFTFSAVVLLIAGPFLDHISARVERELGGIPRPGPSRSFGSELWRAITDSVRLIGIGIAVSLTVFLCGLVPVIGTLFGMLVGAVIGGRVIALEFMGTPGSARGLDFAQRSQLAKTRPTRVLGFGACTYLVFLLPLGAVIAAPAAAVGGTLLTRDLLGEPTRSERF